MKILPKYVFAAAFLLALVPVCSSATTPAPEPAQKLYAQTFGDWSYRCLETVVPGKPETTSCFVQQQLVLSNNGHINPLLTLTLFKGAAKGLTMNIITPLGVALRAGVEISVDNDKPASSSYSFCNGNGCVVLGASAFPLSKDARTGKVGHAKIGLMNDKPLTINFSLKGLMQALTALDSGSLPKTEIKPG